MAIEEFKTLQGFKDSYISDLKNKVEGAIQSINDEFNRHLQFVFGKYDREEAIKRFQKILPKDWERYNKDLNDCDSFLEEKMAFCDECAEEAFKALTECYADTDKKWDEEKFGPCILEGDPQWDFNNIMDAAFIHKIRQKEKEKKEKELKAFEAANKAMDEMKQGIEVERPRTAVKKKEVKEADKERPKTAVKKGKGSRKGNRSATIVKSALLRKINKLESFGQDMNSKMSKTKSVSLYKK